MSDLLGIIAPLRKLLSDDDEVINVNVKGTNQGILELKENRSYVIPDFQREIRWDKDNLSQLIEDIYSGPKYLGNIILTKESGKNEYLIIDGQQRITVITMILCCLRFIHDGKNEVIKPCKLSVKSFEGFEKLLEKNFSDELKKEKNILDTDNLFQINKYYELWNHIKELNYISNSKESKILIDNLEKSNVNIILNESDDTKEGIRYFIDVNLKGKQLDTEDIFKGYLFRNDTSKEIRYEWYELKTNVARVGEKRVKYPLLKFLEHYFYCDLYNDAKYKGLIFDEEFLLKSEFQIKDEQNTIYRRKTHLIEVIGDNRYMLNLLKQLNNIIKIMIDIIYTNSPSYNFISLFNSSEGKQIIDNDNLEIFHNFMGKILKDEKVIPKALLMKYILSILISKDNEKKEKKQFKKIYGVYLLSVLFMIFQSKKNIEVFINILKAHNDTWYEEAIKVINSYFEDSKITDNKIIAQFKKSTNEDEENYKFRCKSLATIYNFFIINNNEIQVKNIKDLKKFVSDDDSFSTEHFIISESKHKQLILKDFNNEDITYKIEDKIYNQYVSNLFNFIFIKRVINSKLSNYWLPTKLEMINIDEVECEYSKMIIAKLKDLTDSMKKSIKTDNYKDELDLFFYKEFKEKYIEYSRDVLNSVIEKITNKS